MALYDLTWNLVILIIHVIYTELYQIITIGRTSKFVHLVKSTCEVSSIALESLINPMERYQKFDGIDIATYVLYIFTGFMSNNTLILLGVISHLVHLIVISHLVHLIVISHLVHQCIIYYVPLNPIHILRH